MSLDQKHLLDEENQVLNLDQGDFITKFNELNRIMASMPDVYEAGKSDDPDLIKSLRKDFIESWIISSTRISYEKDSLEAVIIHYFESAVIEPYEQKLVVPYYDETKLDDVLKDEQGLAYLQALFNTGDDREEIKETLEKLSGKDSDIIKIWTPNQRSRKSNPCRAAGFGYGDDGGFHVDGYGLISEGRSRGVLVNQR